MLDDAAFDVEAWLADEIATEFAKAEGAAFVERNGTNRPKGFLTAYAVGDERRVARVRDAAICGRRARRGISQPTRRTS